MIILELTETQIEDLDEAINNDGTPNRIRRKLQAVKIHTVVSSIEIVASAGYL
jgi:hypothetical protein